MPKEHDKITEAIESKKREAKTEEDMIKRFKDMGAEE